MKKTHIGARIKAALSNPQKDIRAIAPKLNDLEKEIKEIQAMPNQVEAIVRLFQVISPIQDGGGFSQTISQLAEKNYGQLDIALAAITSLQKHISNAGRAEYGMNRTRAGEEVTAAKVYLGNVFGIWTFTASEFLSKKEELDLQPVNGSWNKKHEREASVWECINDYQAGNFVRSHVNGMLEKIGILKKAFAI